MTQVLEMGEEEARRVCREAEEDIRGGKEKRYHWHWQVVGRKPGGRK